DGLDGRDGPRAVLVLVGGGESVARGGGQRGTEQVQRVAEALDLGLERLALDLDGGRGGGRRIAGAGGCGGQNEENGEAGAVGRHEAALPCRSGVHEAATPVTVAGNRSGCKGPGCAVVSDQWSVVGETRKPTDRHPWAVEPTTDHWPLTTAQV